MRSVKLSLHGSNNGSEMACSNNDQGKSSMTWN
uniref:Uncharacterized protein n=1 Tax=Heterorhabditis bacteriophora TaxID=37862 RepID=A0A1I7WQ74_HETBA